MTSWTTRTLGEVATVGAGNSAPQDEALFASGSVPFFRTSDVGRIRFGDIETATDLLNERGAKGLRRFASGTILFPKSGASTFLNHRVMMQADGCVSSHLATIAARRELAEPRFLLYFLATVQAQDLVQDHAYPSLNLPLIAGIKVPLPPISEQSRIVAILDEAFEAIATAKTNTEKNLQNARELFSSELGRLFATDWPRVRIEDACESVLDCVNKTAPTVDEPTPFKMIRTTNVRNGVVSVASVKYVSEETFKVWTRRQVPRRGDVILTREAPMGEVGMLETDDFVFLGQRLISYRADPGMLDGRFLLYALQSAPMQMQIRALASGSTVQHMRVPDSKNLQLPLPPLDKQRQAVELLDSVRDWTEMVVNLQGRKLSALDELRKSLLHQAFTGQLTAKTTDKQLAEVT